MAATETSSICGSVCYYRASVCVRNRAAAVNCYTHIALVSLPDVVGFSRQRSELAQPASSILRAHRGPAQATTDADRFQTCVKRYVLYTTLIWTLTTKQKNT